MANFCHQCGNGLPSTARYCSNCGSAIPPLEPAPCRPMMRPLEGRVIGGVCLAVAQANGWDPAIVRIVTVICCFFSAGFVGIAYLAGWIGIPEEPVNMPGVYPQ